MKYFIVDDNAAMRKIIRTIVTTENDEVKELDDGKDIVELYSKHHPDWVLIDIQMKEVNGIEATKKLKAEFPEAQVIIVTQHDDKIFRRAAKEAKAAGYVLKDDIQVINKIINK